MKDCTPHISVPFLENSSSHTKGQGNGQYQSCFSDHYKRLRKGHGIVWGLSVRFSMNLFHSKVAYSLVGIRRKRDNGMCTDRVQQTLTLTYSETIVVPHQRDCTI